METSESQTLQLLELQRSDLHRADEPQSLRALAALGASRPQTLREAFALFLQLDVADGSPTQDTIDTYWREFRQWHEWCAVNGFHAHEITPTHVKIYREYLKAEGMGVATRNRKLSIVRRVYDAAVTYGLMPTNPAAGIRGGHDKTPAVAKMKHLAQEGLDMLADTPGDTLTQQRDRAIIALESIHGLRRIEINRLDHEHLFDAQTNQPYLMIQGKGGKARQIFLRADTLACVLIYTSSKLQHGLPLSGALFVGHGNRSRGVRLARRSINEVVDKQLIAKGLKRAGVSCHALRHTHGTLAVEGGAKLEHLQKEMGHEAIDTTMIYVEAVDLIQNNPAKFIKTKF